MTGDQQGAQNFFGCKQMAQVAAAVASAGRTGALRIDGAAVAAEPGVLQVYHAPGGKAGAVAGGPGGIDAVKKIDAGIDGFEHVVRCADSHDVAGFLMRQEVCRQMQEFPEDFGALTHRKAADGVAGKIEFPEFIGTAAAQMGKEIALNDAEEGACVGLCMFAPSAFGFLGPECGKAQGFEGFGFADSRRGAHIELHLNVTAHGGLEVHHGLGG